MDEDRDLREAPKNVWEYLKQMKETAQVCRWVWQELVSHEARQWAKRMMLVVFITIILQLAAPFAAQYIFNGLVTTNPAMVLLGLGGWIFCTACCQLTEYRRSRAREIVITNCVGSVDQRITELFFEKSMGQHLQESSSLNQSNIEKGRSRVTMIIEMLLFHGIDIIIRLLLSFLLLWIISPMAGLIMSIVALIHLAGSLYLNKKVVEDFTPVEREWRLLYRRRTERWEKMERVKTCGKETEELQEMQAWTSRNIALDLRFWLWYCLANNIRQVLAIIGVVAIMAYGSWLVWSGERMIGMLYPLFMWAGIVADNLLYLGRIEHQLNWNMPSVNAMKEALTLKPDIICSPDAPVICHKSPVRVAFENVSYTYPRGSKEEGGADKKSPMKVIRNVSFEIAAGEKVALIGPSGAGKTTIMRLLLRYVDPDEGCIHVNGYELHELNLASWMSVVGYIPQQPQVLDGTIRYNLTYGLPNELREKVTDDDVWQLMRLLQIDFGERLTDGLQTVVGRNGVKLSGGQAQRLMIGAAAMKRPLFMIIDEATSNLDSTTERKVYEGFVAEVLSENVSALVIAHRLATVRYTCDKFIVLREAASLIDGDSQVEAVACSFEELYAISPTFRQLADDQEIAIERQPAACSC